MFSACPRPTGTAEEQRALRNSECQEILLKTQRQSDLQDGQRRVEGGRGSQDQGRRGTEEQNHFYQALQPRAGGECVVVAIIIVIINITWP